MDTVPAPADNQIRAAIPAAQAAVLAHIARPGARLTGVQRVAIMAAVRSAEDCALCRERKEALSPNAVSGRHDFDGDLPQIYVDAVHRIVTDQTRLSQSWVAGLADQGLEAPAYVELLAVTVMAVALDTYTKAMGRDPHPLPDPEGGEPAGTPPLPMRQDLAWVPTIDLEKASADIVASYENTSHIHHALSVVPPDKDMFFALQDAQYLTVPEMLDLENDPPGRFLNRAQIELLASKVSALNQCYY